MNSLLIVAVPCVCKNFVNVLDFCVWRQHFSVMKLVCAVPCLFWLSSLIVFITLFVYSLMLMAKSILYAHKLIILIIPFGFEYAKKEQLITVYNFKNNFGRRLFTFFGRIREVSLRLSLSKKCYARQFWGSLNYHEQQSTRCLLSCPSLRGSDAVLNINLATYICTFTTKIFLGHQV